MNLKKAMDFGRYYVIFARGRQFRGRVIRLERSHVDIACGTQITRLGTREVKAVLEPPMKVESVIYA
jgi:hypothetical protein